MRPRDSDGPFVIVGGGVTGGNAAATLRDEGFTGRVIIINEEPGVPFGRPPLSKTYLRSEEELENWYVRPADWYQGNDVERISGTRVKGVDVPAHTVALDS
ncbi:MAG: FAD-dependent oxidoreductase, partial [Nocardiopsaceae bacterium]|nr:FAD-dependent oxidoreductase [Nocardiopsaceae bacterium]